MSTLLINETFLNTSLRTRKSGFALKSVFLSGFTLLRAFLSAQKSTQGPTQPLWILVNLVILIDLVILVVTVSDIE